MRKYLELFEEGFPSDMSDRTAIENWPYVGHDINGGVVYTVVPKPQPDDEIWYTSSDGEVVNPGRTYVFGANIVSNTYKDGKGVITFDGEVTSIGNYAFYEDLTMTSITIPNSVTSIGPGAFWVCYGLTSITIPNSVTSIGEEAFRSCESLTSITYEGTQAQWNTISKVGSWNYGVPATYVQCSDGRVAL